MTVARGSVALLLDEMFPPAIADELRKRGHDVIAVAADVELRSKTDQEVFVWAAEHERRLVTENVKDFRRLVAARQGEERGASLLYTSSRTFPRSRRAPGALIAALDRWLSAPDAAAKPVEDWLSSAESSSGDST